MTVNVTELSRGDILEIDSDQVPFAKDPKATTRPNTLVSLPSWPIQVTVTKAPRK